MKENDRFSREFEVLLDENRDKESAPVRVVKTLTSWVQETLNVLNKLNLPISGKLDTATVAAIRSFQTQNGLSVTGKVDAPLERQLMEQLALTKAGVGKIAAYYGIIQSAKTKIEDWTKHADIADRRIVTNQYRHPDRVWALVLHHMAFKRLDKKKRLYSQPENYLRTLAHFCILFNGRIIQLHPISRMIWHSQCTSGGSIGVEFEGNFPNDKGKWWVNDEPNKKGEVIRIINEDYPTAPQIEAGRFLLRYLQVVNNLKTVLAHRQSSMDRADDPGPDVWFNVGEWAT